MTEREKMAQIIAEHLCPQGRAHKTLYGAERMCYSRNNFADCEKVSECVDALIEAGFGDVKDCREYYKQAHDVAQRAFHVWDEMFVIVKLWETETQKEEAEHRAEVAEKDLERYKRALCCACKASAAVLTKELVKARVDCFLRKAEKELAEVKK